MPHPEVATVAHSFSAFPQDDRTWEVIMYGQVHQSLMGRGIDVLLADSTWRRGSTGERPVTRQIYRPLGDVAGLPIGSCWKNGATAPTEGKAETIVIAVPPLDGFPDQKLGEAYPTERTKDRPAYPLVGIEAAPVWRIPSREGVYFVPAIEVIRAVFGPTTGLLRLAVEGGAGLWPTKQRMIFDPERSGPDKDDPSLVRIKAYRSLYRREAETVARILTNRRMRTAFMQVFASVQRAETNGKVTFPTTIFPFDQPTQWTVEAVWTHVNRPGGWRRLVTRVHAIKAPLPFRKVLVELAGGGGELEPGEKRRPVSAQSPDTVGDRIKIHPHRPPASNLAATALQGGHTSHESGFVLEHVVVDETGRQATVVVPKEDDVEIEIGSTGWGRGSRQGVAAVTFLSSAIDYPDEPREADGALRSTRNAVELLARKKGWPCEVVSPPFGDGADPKDALHRYPPANLGRSLSWSIMRDGRLRRALVMRLTAPQGNIYVFDAERHGEGEGHALGLMLIPSRTLFDYEAIEDVLAINAQCRGVWREEKFNFPSSKQKRNATWFSNIQAYKDGLVAPISHLLKGAAPAP